MQRRNLIQALQYARAGRLGDAGEESLEAMKGFLADTGGSLGRMWKRKMVYDATRGRTPTAGSRKRELDFDKETLDVMMPMIRPLRIVDYDADRVKQILPYKLGPMAAKVAGMRAGMRVPVKAARDYLDFKPGERDPEVVARLIDQYGEAAVRRMKAEELYLGGATEEELAKGLVSMGAYLDALKDLEERLAVMRPAWEYVGISDETIIQNLYEGLPIQNRLRRPEAEAVVRGTVDQFEWSDDFYAPESKPSGLMKGEDQIEMALRNDPYVNARHLYSMLQAGGYEVGTWTQFQQRYKRIRDRVYRNY
jgi:hypothetical protein